MDIFRYLPERATQIQFVRPNYEYYEDEDGCGYDECTNEDRATDVIALIRKLLQDKIPFYYRRRNVDYALEDKLTWLNHCGINKYPVLVRKVGKRVVFEYNDKLAEKYAQGGKYNRRQPTGKIRKHRWSL